MRIICFILIVLIAYFLPFWIYVPSIFLYAMVFRKPYELLVPAIFIDTQFGWSGAYFGLMYVGSAVAAIVVAQFLKPYLRSHTTLL